MRLLVIAFALAAAACGTSTPPTDYFDCSKENCRDCAVLSAKLSWDSATQQLCTTCQGADAGVEPDCFNFPTESGRVVVQGCDTDGDCQPLSTFCGHYTGQPHFTCVQSDAK